MRAFLLFMLLAACTMPPDVPVKEVPPTKETGIAEAPPPPPKPKPQKPPPVKTVETPPPAPPKATCPAPVNPKKRILQELDCLIEETKAIPKP